MRDLSVRRLLLVVVLLLAPASGLASESSTPLETFDIPSDAPGLALHLEHRGPPSGVRRGGKRVVLLLHGNFFPASSSFGVELPGLHGTRARCARGDV
jgi:hypothetical protein